MTSAERAQVQHVDKNKPDDHNRPEFSGDEQLDQVLVHLRVVKERRQREAERREREAEEARLRDLEENGLAPEIDTFLMREMVGDPAADGQERLRLDQQSPPNKSNQTNGVAATPAPAATASSTPRAPSAPLPRSPATAPPQAAHTERTLAPPVAPPGASGTAALRARLNDFAARHPRQAGQTTPRAAPAAAPTGNASPSNRQQPPEPRTPSRPAQQRAPRVSTPGRQPPQQPDAARQSIAEKPARPTRPAAPPSPRVPASTSRPDAALRATAQTTVRTGGELWHAIMANKPAFRAMARFSFVSNILMLAGPLFMLQVYDRVLTSGSMPTLVALSILTAVVYVVIGLLDMVRSRVIVRVGIELDHTIGERIFAASVERSIAKPGTSMSALRELDQVRQFIAGPGPLTAFDAPWTPVYLLVIFLTHWALGIAATIGGAALIAIAWSSERRSRQPLAEASKAAAKSFELADGGQRNAESIKAMGMLPAYLRRWQRANADAQAWQVLAADRLASMSSLSKALRLLLQSLMLAIGAALAIHGDISAGAIIAGTIIFGRAMAPVEQAVAQWRNFVKARESYDKLEELLKAYPEPQRRTSLPPPKGVLEVRSLRVAAPDMRQLILTGLSFAVQPGQVLAVIGPSASGKSTLVRSLVGLWPSVGGEIRLDGARLDQWNADELGQNIGYLPQSVDLFAGTVAENIARFTPGASDVDVTEAAHAAHAHDLIMALPQGYDTQLGAFGAHLSAGQRQRIGLARALYGNPAVVVLDEPNANLDRLGDEALAAAIDGMRARGQTVVLVSHRVQAIGKADLLLYIENGQQRAFGPREQVLAMLRQTSQAQDGQQNGSRGPNPPRRPERTA
ncbi:MAG: type I secretion system permease/ATPase [Hyphomicrobiaceae bacterium]